MRGKSRLTLDRLDTGGVFETLRSYGGKILALDLHLARLAESAKGIGRRLPFKLAALAQWVRKSLNDSKMPDAYIRLMASFEPDGPGGILILAMRPFAGPDPALHSKGVRVRTASVRKSSLKAQSPAVKSNQYLGAVMSLLEESPRATDGPYFETLFLGPEGFLAEGRISNVAIVKGGALFTPSGSCGILMGVTRHLVLEAAAAEGIPCRETPLTRHELYTADEAFLTTTLSEVVPIVAADGRRIGSGRPGPLTRRIHGAYRRLKERHL